MAHISAPARLIVVLAAVGLLAGCATPSPGGTSPSGDRIGTSPSPSEAPTGPPSLSDLTIGPDAFGDYEIGARLADADPATDALVFVEDRCAAGSTDPSFGTGRWVANYEPALGDPEQRAPFAVDTLESALREVAAFDPAIATERGIHLGSTEAEVAAAYPDAEVVERTDQIRFYVVRGELGRMIIEIVDDPAVAESGGTPGTVFSLSSKVDPAGDVSGFWATANSVGLCFSA